MEVMEIFSDIPDPRVERTRDHKLIDIVMITLAAVICGSKSWYDIEEFGHVRHDWLKGFPELPEGIPSHDTFNRFFSAIDNRILEERFVRWVSSISEKRTGVVAIDGKCLKSSRKKGSKSFTTMVGAWSQANGLCIAQVKTADKSNEIKAIPELLDLLFLEGCTVTIDAAGCQTAIAEKIREKGADYVLVVKGNQGSLKEGIEDTMRLSEASDVHEYTDFGHGRIEIRKCRVYGDLTHLNNPVAWKGLKSLAVIEAERIEKSTGVSTNETRLYISNLEADAAIISKAVREHWGIENRLHWSLDVTFGEDGDKKRAGNANVNFSIVNRIVLNILKSDPKKRSLAGKRLNAAWDVTYLEKLLKLRI